jgi:2-amino-4-hydroxy-6-hydroxymethyldihydropteridine diphosphokinase
MADVFIALGSNLGNRAKNLALACEALARDGIEIAAASSVYETEPWGPKPQGPYLNRVVRGTTELAPKELLARLLETERTLGRKRDGVERYGPRTIDLDILLYGGETLAEPELQIPHPRMMERAFVLVPLAEIAPDLTDGGVAVEDALARLDRSGVALYTG